MKYIKHINEYLNQDMVSIKKYFSMSEDEQKNSLPHEFYYLFDDFESENIIEVNFPEDMEDYEKMEWLEENDKDVFNDFANYLYNKVNDFSLGIPDSEYPAWCFFDNSPELIKNQWLIHFTNDAEAIARDGFKFGVDDMSKLGLTTNLGTFDKKYGGYNFAYSINDFDKYAKNRHGYKYGKEMVLFIASGLKMWHHGDEEPQVIFYGNTAKNITPITGGENHEFAIRSKKSGNVLFESDELTKIVDWLTSNYEQYRKNF